MNPHDDVGTPPPTSGVRLRRDLEISEQLFRGRRYWVIKDPVALEYFRFPEREFAILEQLDGRRSIEEIKSYFDQRFAPRQIAMGKIQSFIADLYQAGLVIADTPGQGEILSRRHFRRRRVSWIASLSNVLAIRFRGLDPDYTLGRVLPFFRAVVGFWTFVISIVVVIAAAALVVGHWTTIQNRLPELHTLISARNLIWLAVVLGAAKALHELAHALTCKRFGGECHELGLMLLVFTPCLYCDVSDSWMQPNRWKRMAVTSAGVWVELVLAAICTFGWWYSRPGIFNGICLNVMLVCGVGTVLINGNPLLRYDGYYLLSDLMDVPNLWQESRVAVSTFLRKLVFGIVSPADDTHSLPKRLLLSYGIASMLYRGFVLVAIVFMLDRTLRPLGLQIVTQLIVTSIIAAMVLSAVSKASQFVRDPELWNCINPFWTSTAFLIGTTLLYAAFQVPFASSIQAMVVVGPAEAQSVYVQAEGELFESVEVGEQVSAGQILVRLRNPQLDREVEELAARVQRQEQRLRNLKALRAIDEESNNQIPTAQQLLTDLHSVLAQKRRQHELLVLRAPRSGVVLPPVSSRRTYYDSDVLDRWRGNPLELRNVGCWLDRMTQVCLIGPSHRYEAIVFVNEADISLVMPGQAARLRLDTNPGSVLHATTKEVATSELQVVPKHLMLGQEIPHRLDEDGVARPLHPLYQVRVAIDETSLPLLLDARGQAKISVAPQTLMQRFLRFLSRTVRQRA